jgi:hypothetical protein
MRGPIRGGALPALAAACVAGVAFAQGQDGTPGERNLQIMAGLLPGIYDNSNQAYFDQRLAFPEEQRFGRMHVRIEQGGDDGAGVPAFSFTLSRPTSGEPERHERWLLRTDDDPLLVRMQRYSLREGTTEYRDGCDVLWRRDVGQFTGTGVSDQCPAAMQLSPRGLWLGPGESRPAELLRARPFSCYVDIPGVAGGRDEPFERTPIGDMHDQGALQWFTTKDGRELGITLRNVRWPMNNEVGAFTRDSLVMYVLEKTPDGVATVTYGWTEPRAERIGLNLQWMLVNCFMVSNRDVAPFFD